MKIKHAFFEIIWREHEYGVKFQDEQILVTDYESHVVAYNNSNGSWKPCVTHAMEMVRLAFGQTPKTGFAKRRAKAARTTLKVVGCDRAELIVGGA